MKNGSQWNNEGEGGQEAMEVGNRRLDETSDRKTQSGMQGRKDPGRES